MQKIPSTSELIGGRWTVSWQTFVIGGALIFIATFILPLPLHEAPTTPLFLVGTAMAGTLAFGATLLIAHLTLFRHRRTTPIPIWGVVTLGILCGLTRLGPTLLAFYLDGALALNAVTLAAMALTGVISGAFFLPSTALILATRDSYTQRRNELIAQDIEVERETQALSLALDEKRQQVIATVRAQVERIQISTLTEGRVGGIDDRNASALAFSDALLELARGSVRSESQRLDTPATIAYPSIGWVELHRAALRTRPLPILATLVPYSLFFAASGLLAGQSGAVPLNLLIGAALIIPIFRVGQALAARRPDQAPLIAIAACLAAGIPQMLIWIYVLTPIEPHPRAVGGVVILVAISTVASVLLTVRQQAIDVIRALTLIVDHAEISRRAVQIDSETIDRELAAYLHSNVQTELVASSYAIQAAAATGTSDDVERALDRASRILVAPPKILGSELGSTSLTEVFAQLDQHWEPLLPTLFTLIGDDVPADPAVLRVITECLSNAMIHGHASRASVVATTTASELTLTITDDGNGPQGGPVGLGSRIMNEATRSWSLQPAPTGGSVVFCTLAF